MLTIRSFEESDAPLLASFMMYWGEPLSITPADILHQVRHCRERVSGEVFLAFSSDRTSETLVGYIQLCEISLVGLTPSVEIAAILVHPEWRGQGIGALLVAKGERWACKRGVDRILVSSQAHRETAHRFYEREGFKRWKQSVFFCKEMTRTIWE